MATSTFTNVYKRLKRYKAIENLATVLRKTPEPAVHWYIIMLIGLIVTILNVSAAWIVFRSVSAQGDDIFNQMTKASTINRTDLQESLDTYRMKVVELDNLKQKPTQIIDPGR
ncbi:hypothetical protein JXR01_02370 [Candidatus Kaiserbacteria bacterium]|nr:MAG: hypothetical protein JXR01_02370 [Candidatus Kaiserbacteria bacterium]